MIEPGSKAAELLQHIAGVIADAGVARVLWSQIANQLLAQGLSATGYDVARSLLAREGLICSHVSEANLFFWSLTEKGEQLVEWLQSQREFDPFASPSADGRLRQSALAERLAAAADTGRQPRTLA